MAKEQPQPSEHEVYDSKGNAQSDPPRPWAPIEEPPEPADTDNSEGSIQDNEASGATPQPTGEQSAERRAVADKTDDKGGLFKGKKDEGKPRGRINRRQKIMSSTLAGVVVGGSFGLFTVAGGPFKFMQIAQLFDKFHMSDQEDFFEGRTTQLYRYFKWTDKPQNRRLSRLGNFLADKIDAKLKKNGMDLEFTERGRASHVNINPKKFPSEDLPRVKADFNTEGFEFDTGEVNARGEPIMEQHLRVDIEGRLTTVGKEKGLFKSIRKASGNTGPVAAMEGWMFGRRTGLTRHPIKRGDAWALDRRMDFQDWLKGKKDAWKERKKNIIEEGDVDTTVRAVDTDEEGEDGRPANADAQDAADEVGDLTHDIPADASPEVKVETVRGKMLAKAGVVSMVIGLTCFVNDMASNAGALEYANIVMPSMRVASYYMGLGSQSQSNMDVDFLHMGFEAANLWDESDDGNPATLPNDFLGSRSILANEGKDGGRDTPNASKIGGSTNVLTAMQQMIPGVAAGLINRGCGAANSVVGQVISFGIDLATGPFSAVAGLGAGFIASPFMDDLVRMIAGSEISTDLTGAALGSVADQGAFFLGSSEFITMGATQLTNQESMELRERRIARQKEENEDKSWSERYLSLTNVDSLASNVFRAQPRSPTEIAEGIANAPASALSAIARPFSGKASAAPAYDYGVSKYAFRPSETTRFEADESYKNPFENANRVSDISGMHTEYSEKCFGLKFDNQENFEITKPVSLQDYPTECKNTDENFTRYRLYIGDLMVFATNACYEGDEEACKQVGFGNVTGAAAGVSGQAGALGEGGGKGQDTSAQPCQVGAPAGLGVTPDPNVNITLCNVDGTIVNVLIERNVRAVFDGIAAAGHSMTGGGGYRSHAAQIVLRRSHCGTSNYDIYEKPSGQCSPPTARPGNSMHEWGLAVDFRCDGGSMSSHTSPCWIWMNEHPDVHHLTNLPSEAWHWSSTGN